MIDLNKDISHLELNPLIVNKLQQLHINKLGDLVATSYPELFHTHAFADEELEEIKNVLNDQSLDFIDEINLDNIIYLKRDIIKYAFSVYQKDLYYFHIKKYDENQVEPLHYSYPLYIANYLFTLYKLLHPEEKDNFSSYSKISLNKFLTAHPHMTISSFVDIKKYPKDADAISQISTILGLPLNSELPFSEMIERENKIFAGENVQSATIQMYEDIATLDNENLDNYLKSQVKTLTKSYKK